MHYFLLMAASHSLFLQCNYNVKMEWVIVLETTGLRPVLYSIKYALYLTTEWEDEKK